MIVLYRIYLRVIGVIEKRFREWDLALMRRNITRAGGKIGNDLSIGNGVVISGLDQVDIGDNVSIGTGSFIRAEGGLKIGNNVVISRNVVLYTTSHNYEGDSLPFDRTNILNEVIIEDNVWIGMNVTIAPGTIIREGAIIALGSRIWGEVERCKIVGSVSPKLISERDLLHYESLRGLGDE